MDEEAYRDLRDFVQNKPRRSVDRVMRERAAMEAKAADALRTSPRPKLVVRMQRPTATEKNRKIKGIMKMGNKKELARPARLRISPRSPHSPRFTGASILNPGIEDQIAWNGVPRQLKLMHYDERDARAQEAQRARRAQEQQEQRERAEAEAEAEAERREQERLAQALVAVPMPETREQQKQRARAFLREQRQRQDSAREPESESSRGADAEAEEVRQQRIAQRHWRDRKALARKRQRGAAGSDPRAPVLSQPVLSQPVLSQPALASPTRTPRARGNQQRESPARSVSALLRSSGSCERRVTGYADMCKLARAQVLEARKRQLGELARRRAAAVRLQRALRNHVNKACNRRAFDAEVSRVLLMENRKAAQLQALFRAHRARVMVTQQFTREAAAAKRLQRMVRKSAHWRKQLAQHTAVVSAARSRLRAEESAAEKEHFDWVQRVMRRSRKEDEGITRRRSMLECTPDNVRDWIVSAPNPGHNADEVEAVKARAKNQLLVQLPEAHPGEGAVPSPRPSFVVAAPSAVPRLSLAKLDNVSASVSARASMVAVPKAIASLGLAPTPAAGGAASPDSNSERLLTATATATATVLGPSSAAPTIHTVSSGRQRRYDDTGLLASATSTLAHDEFKAMNSQITRELGAKVSSVHGRVHRLRTTLHNISKHEKQLPSLLFDKKAE